MLSQLRSLVLWGGVDGPNPPKVAMVLEELNLPLTAKYIPITEVKGPEYEKINPNGRLPSLEDPNTGITVWGSGAILEYLVSEYDKEHKLSFPTGTFEFYHAKQWLIFQVSGQGPYFGQVYYFQHHHSKKVQSVIDRFINEVLKGSMVGEAFDPAKEFPHLQAWLERLQARPAVKKVLEDGAARAEQRATVVREGVEKA